MLGTDSPWTSTSPSSGYSRPTMCLMHTDLPVPDGPRIIEILSSGMPRLRPRRILLRPNALWTSTNSTASGTPVGRCAPVCHLYSSSWWWVSVATPSASDWCSGVGSPEELGAEHAYEMYQHDVQDHRFRGGRAHAHRAPARVVPVVTADEHDHGGHGHALDHAEQQVGWVLEHPEDQRVPAAGDLADLLDHGQAGGEKAGADPGEIQEREPEPGGEQAGRAQVDHALHAHDL